MNYLNIINFIRGCEPRCKIDLFEPVREQMALSLENDLPTTWLLQYDALTEGPYTNFLIEKMPDTHECGMWFEFVQAAVEKSGLKWRGRYPWDWHTDVGFSIGYLPEERERIADVMMEAFQQRFGHYPSVIGCWFFDAHLLSYLSDRYGITAAVNCRDQWGTDGYTLWGGYWANGYYPSRRNAYLPAQTSTNQIHVPVFRMLGSDPIYQYASSCDPLHGQEVITLEPVYKTAGGGGTPSWVDWYFKEVFPIQSPSLTYVHMGQENSFGWPAMSDGYRYQIKKVKELQDNGTITVNTLGELGKIFRHGYAVTPCSLAGAESDWKNENRKSVWYLSRKWRLQFHRNRDRKLFLVDWHMFSDTYEELYLKTPCTTNSCLYDALPLLDGNRWRTEGLELGTAGDWAIRMRSPETMELNWRSDDGRLITIIVKDGELISNGNSNLIWHETGQQMEVGGTKRKIENRKLLYTHNDHEYSLACNCLLSPCREGFQVVPETENIIFRINKQ